ncbi:MAG: DUF4339 domain-containing protein [Planctomycetia bacterium]|nr:DUF4339 domain-containing protein [Planctomycetia bacterium]
MTEAVKERWFVQFPDKTSGPFTFAQLQKLAQTGRLAPVHLVSDNELTWKEAGQVAGLAFAAADAVDKLPRGHMLARCSCGKEYAVLGSYAGTMRPCPKCGAKNLVPLNSAATDDTEVRPATRPLLLAVWTIALVALTAGLMVGGTWHYFRFFRTNASWDLTVLAALLGGAAQVFLLFELRSGKSWAWIGIQVLWAVAAFALFVAPGDWVQSLLRAVALLAAVLPFWAHLYAPGVATYCFANRVAE